MICLETGIYLFGHVASSDSNKSLAKLVISIKWKCSIFFFIHSFIDCFQIRTVHVFYQMQNEATQRISMTHSCRHWFIWSILSHFYDTRVKWPAIAINRHNSVVCFLFSHMHNVCARVARINSFALRTKKICAKLKLYQSDSTDT